MTNLARELEKAEARAAQLRLQIKQGTCRETGHDWYSYGGRNAGCDLDGDCLCSVPVSVCSKCGDCDYGDDAEAEEIRAKCLADSTF